MRRVYAIAFLLAGIGLCSIPLRLFEVSANAPGDGGPNFVPVFQAGGALIGAVVAFGVAWSLFKRRS